MKYAILLQVTASWEGDERSRTNPGHGYPAGSSTSTEFKPMVSQKALCNWILQNHDREKFIAIEYNELQFTQEVTVTFTK